MEKFIKKCLIKFGDRFDYSNINYINSLIKIEIKCNEHDVYFSQIPAEHLRGRNGCKICQKPIKNILPKNKNKTITKE